MVNVVLLAAARSAANAVTTTKERIVEHLVWCLVVIELTPVRSESGVSKCTLCTE